MNGASDPIVLTTSFQGIGSLKTGGIEEIGNHQVPLPCRKHCLKTFGVVHAFIISFVTRPLSSRTSKAVSSSDLQ